MRNVRPAILALATFSCLALPAWDPASAQGMNPGALSTPGIGGPKRTGPVPSEKAPDAVPGARADQAPVAPIAKNAIDLPPNEALFDAINRGDLAVAKDAVGRGADLSATNVLGLTPIELAVDLGRNRISFYLLSLRGGVSGTNNPPPSGAAPKPPTRAERLAADRQARLERDQRVRTTNVAAPPAPPKTARLFAGNGGTPAPQSGFLGFEPAIR